MISVVIPLYNKEQYITRAIDSIMSGHKLPDEIIVVDDGSTDNGAEVAANTRCPILRVIRQQNAGVAAARNTGIREAKGDYIAFLDADDMWYPDFLKTVCELAEKYPQAGIFCTAYEQRRHGARYPVTYAHTPPSEGIIQNLFACMSVNSPVSSSSAMVRAEVFDRLGGFLVGEKVGEDVELWCRISMEYPVAFSATVCAGYFTDAVNRAYTPKNIRRAAGYTAMLERAALSVDEHIKPSVLVLRENVELGFLSSCVMAGQKKEARKVYRSFSFSVYSRQALMWFLLSYLPVFVPRALLAVKQRIVPYLR